MYIKLRTAPQPRQGNHFPTTLKGKAFDTALVMEWLGEELMASEAECSEINVKPQKGWIKLMYVCVDLPSVKTRSHNLS